METLRSLFFQQQPDKRGWGMPVWNQAATASAASWSSTPPFSFCDGFGVNSGSVLPGGGVRGADGDIIDTKKEASGVVQEPLVSDSPVAFSKQQRKHVGSQAHSSSAVGSPLKDTKASDYAVPQKYLENPEKIPSYYVFQSNMVTDEDLKPGMLRNLEVDKRLTLPTRTHIRFLVTATDVIHSWSVPSLGIKADAIPGRLQRVTAFIQREGVYYGQCSELCGSLHGFMPIVVEAVSPETYAAHAKKWYRDE